MIEFEDLTDVQQQALVDAFGEPDDYSPPRFSRVDDPVEAAGYEVFRDSMEGLYVEQGDMDDERFESYKKRGILREEEDGDVVVNSVWRDSQVEELQENGMVDFDAVELYESENRDDMVVLDSGEGFKFDIRDGSLTYELPGTDTVNDAEYESGEKVEEITEDFVKFFSSEEDEEDINSGYENIISSKSGEKFRDGGEIMEDYDEIKEELEELRGVTQEFYELTEDAAENTGLAEDVVDQVNAVEGMVNDLWASYREAESNYDDAADQIHEMDRIVEGVYRTIDVATEKLGSIYEDLEENVQETGETLEDAYGRLETLAGRTTPDFTPDPRVREVADKIEGTDVDEFDEFVESFEEIGSSE